MREQHLTTSLHLAHLIRPEIRTPATGTQFGVLDWRGTKQKQQLVTHIDAANKAHAHTVSG